MRGKTLGLPPSTSTPPLFGSVCSRRHGTKDALVERAESHVDKHTDRNNIHLARIFITELYIFYNIGICVELAAYGCPAGLFHFHSYIIISYIILFNNSKFILLLFSQVSLSFVAVASSAGSILTEDAMLELVDMPPSMTMS